MTRAQEKRKDRAEARVDALRGQTELAWEKATAAVAGIPMGQPVFEGAKGNWHRRAIERSHAAADKAVELNNAAKQAAWSAGGAGQAILSDDPEALVALREKLAKLVAEQDCAKRLNAAWKKNGQDGLRALGLSEETVARIAKTVAEAYSWDKRPVAACTLTNRNARIRQVKERIEKLEKLEERREEHPEPVWVKGEGWTIEEDLADVRLRIRFASRLDRDQCAVLKQHGFRWSPTSTAWQRQLGGSARYSAGLVIKALFSVEVTWPGASAL